ncbi:hypothetical protein VA596_48030 [Amycolatopsis sp., V23-08]|uniref:Integral membrane protein n=1 Tax=Amycolatopsis heterodermiae TaxID=3110235 RepID=A0ABU5RM26_9PSEU|nr:hypothetical protein [Amycolatopsis sp., V23-08]MEA5367352.1 hypothetical protein [Amycolatopsis sp., V23-08]
MADDRPHPLPPRRIRFAVTCWFLAAAGGFLAFLFGSAAAMSTGSCRPDDTVFPCTATGQQVVFWLPPIGWIASILIAWAAAAALVRSGRPRWPAIPVGVVSYAAVLAADWFAAVR